jgi:hypothetical protein
MGTTKIAGTPVLGAFRYDLGELGYTNDEFVLDGVARSYDGEPEQAFATRLVVRRPIDTSRFNGVVFVEWLNVSGGQDTSVEWDFVHRHFMRTGAAWVGVSVQQAGIDGGGLMAGLHLKLASPERYHMLVHPGDRYAFDLFSQAGSAVRTGAGSLLGGPSPTLLIAGGQSQSAGFLTTYINEVDPEAKVFDGFLVHGRPANGSPLNGALFPRGEADAGEAVDVERRIRTQVPTKGTPIRSDVRVPVLTLQSEFDVVALGGYLIRQPDTERIRLWEVAGTAHADTYLTRAHNFDDGRIEVAELARRLQASQSPLGMTTSSPINAAPQFHYVMQAAVEHLVGWSGGGAPPPEAPRLATSKELADLVVRDDRGNAEGGIRSPWMDVPLATFSGLGQRGEMFAYLFGTTAPFDDATLRALYPSGTKDYLQQFRASLDQSIAAGFILGADEAEILALAEASVPAGLGP